MPILHELFVESTWEENVHKDVFLDGTGCIAFIDAFGWIEIKKISAFSLVNCQWF